MARKIDGTTKRIRIIVDKAPKDHAPSFWEAAVHSDIPVERFGDLWNSMARDALTFGPSRRPLGPLPVLPGWSQEDAAAFDKEYAAMMRRDDDMLRRVFEFFKLDPGDPWSWRILVQLLAWIMFWKPPAGKAGRRKEWTEQALKDLAAEISAGGMWERPDTQIAKAISRKRKSGPSRNNRTGDNSSRGLRARVAEARRVAGKPRK